MMRADSAMDLDQVNMLRLIADNMPDMVVVVDERGLFRYLSPSVGNVSGYAAEERLGKPVLELVHPDDVERVRSLFEASLRGSSSTKTVEYRCRNTGGCYRWLEAMGKTLRDDRGAATGAVICMRDITERKQAEQTIRQSETGLRLLTDYMLDMVTRADRRGTIQYVSSSNENVLGYKPEELLGRHIFEFVHPDDLSRTIAAFRAGMRTPTEGRMEIRFKRAGGHYLWLEIFGRPLLDERGAITGAVFGSRDITERKQAERALRKSEEQFRTLFEMAPIGIDICRGDRHLVSNQAYLAMHGYRDMAEIAGKTVLEQFAPAFRRQTEERIRGRAEGKITAESIEGLAQRKDGSFFPFHLESGRIELPDGPASIGFLIDISERKQVEDALWKSQERLHQSYEEVKQLLASISQIIIGVDSGGMIAQWNTAAEKAFGIEAAAVAGKPFMECGIRWDWHKLQEIISVGKTGNLPEEIAFTKPDGKEGLLGFNVNFARPEPGRKSGYIIVGTEISERKIYQTQQILSQKLEAIGQLAAGMAHEINTPMQYISDNTRFLQDGFQGLCGLIEVYGKAIAAAGQAVPSAVLAEVRALEKQVDIGFLTAEIPQAIEQSLDGIDRVSKLLLAMKEFSHSGSREKRLADLNRAIEGTATIARHEWKFVAELELDLEPDLPPVNCVIDEINQVVLNMIVNSIQAIAQVQSSTARAGAHRSGKGKITIGTKTGAGCVEIRISDTGAGIPQENLHRIFDPFFTTKEVGQGTGQGLAIAHDIIVNKHQGSIQVQSQAGMATTFTIRLPLAPRP
jgi:PAS domain S-box-containing protein